MSKEEILKRLGEIVPNRVYEAVGGDIAVLGYVPEEKFPEFINFARSVAKVGRLYEDEGFFLSRDEWRKVIIRKDKEIK